MRSATSRREQNLQDIAFGEGSDKGLRNDVLEKRGKSQDRRLFDIGFDDARVMLAASTFIPAPGCQRLTATRPMISAVGARAIKSITIRGDHDSCADHRPCRRNLWQPGAGMKWDAASINSGIVEPYVKQTAVRDLPRFSKTSFRKPCRSLPEAISCSSVLSVTCGFALIWAWRARQAAHGCHDVAAKYDFCVVRIVMWAAPLGLRRDRLHRRKIGLGSLASSESWSAGFT